MGDYTAFPVKHRDVATDGRIENSVRLHSYECCSRKTPDLHAPVTYAVNSDDSGLDICGSTGVSLSIQQNTNFVPEAKNASAWGDERGSCWEAAAAQEGTGGWVKERRVAKRLGA